MVDALAPVCALFALHTRLFGNTIADLDDRAARVRPGASTNSVAFIAGHLVETRAWMGRYLGLDTPPPFGGQLEHATAIDEIAALPAVAEIRDAWQALSGRIAPRLEALTAAELAAPSSQRFPGATSVLEALTFLMHHEAYHIGQLGYLRKFVGLPPMSYR